MTRAQYRFLGLATTPAVCAECGRECPERHIVVADEAGNTVRLGVSCAWKVAGIKPTDRVEVEPASADTAEESYAFMLSWMDE